MVRILLLAIVVGAGSFGCNKDSGTSDHGHDGHAHNTEQMQPDTGEPKAMLYLHVEAKARGTGESAPLAGVGVHLKAYAEPQAGGEADHFHPDGVPHVSTNTQGNASVALIPDKKYVVHFVAPGYGQIVRIVEEAEGAERHLWLKMAEVQATRVTIPESGAIDVPLGDSVDGASNPVTLTIEQGDLGRDSGEGAAVSGEIEITHGTWDPIVDDPSSYPSDLLTASGPLLSYGMFNVEFKQGDNVLNVRAGQTVAWSIKVNEALRDQASEAIAMNMLKSYSLDHGSGLWVEEPDAPNEYDAELGVFTSKASHFSHINCDQPGPFPSNSCLDISVVDQNGNNIAAQISIAGRGNASAGCNNIACSIARAAAEQVAYQVTARRRVVGNRWIQESANVSTTCDDINVGCGTGRCSNVRITMNLCHVEDEPCNVRGDCCDGLGCFNGTCAPCSQQGTTCADSNECCGGLDCTDFQCFTP